VSAVRQALCPPGTILPYAGDTAPAGWLLCDGTFYGGQNYPDLFAVIGTRFGSPGGNTFRVPDFRGRFLRGRDGGVSRDPDRTSRTAMNPGGATGDAVGTVQNHAFQSHTHSYNQWNTTNGDDTSSGQHEVNGTYSTETAASGSSTETRPVNAYVNYIIKY